MLKKTLLVVALLAATAIPALAEKIDNPEYLSWKTFKPGAMVKVEHVTKMADTETKTVTTTTLKKLTDAKAVVTTQTTMFVMGNTVEQPAQDREIPATFDKPEMPGEPEGVEKPDIEMEEGEETLTVGGKEVACKWVKSTVKAVGTTVVATSWNSDAVPGGLVKMESTTSGAMKVETRMTVTEFKTE